MKVKNLYKYIEVNYYSATPKYRQISNAIKVFCVQHPDKIEEIIFVCFEQENYNIYKTLLQLNIYTT